eukprot:1098294-Rhodomonas_salina.1
MHEAPAPVQERARRLSSLQQVHCVWRQREAVVCVDWRLADYYTRQSQTMALDLVEERASLSAAIEEESSTKSQAPSAVQQGQPPQSNENDTESDSEGLLALIGDED